MKRVFVAEDDFVISKLYQIHFQRSQIIGTFFATGQEILESARLSPPDLVILDFELPDIRGPEVMRLLHQVPGCEKIPVIFVTGRATPEVVESLLREGASEVFGKPFSPLQLIHLIEQLTQS